MEVSKKAEKLISFLVYWSAVVAVVVYLLKEGKVRAHAYQSMFLTVVGFIFEYLGSRFSLYLPVWHVPFGMPSNPFHLVSALLFLFGLIFGFFALIGKDIYVVKE